MDFLWVLCLKDNIPQVTTISLFTNTNIFSVATLYLRVINLKFEKRENWLLTSEKCKMLFYFFRINQFNLIFSVFFYKFLT